MKPGFFCLPRHDPTLVGNVIRQVQPSLVKFWVSSTSAGQVRAWRESSPSTIFLAVDGGIGDNPEKNNLDFDLKAKAREHVSAWCRWRDQGFGSLYMTYNEPPVWSGKEYRKRLVEYTAEALRQAHAAGINLCIFNFSVAWPKAVLDDENWWPEFEPAIKEMRAGDYLGLHEYWPRQGPLDLAVYPWMAGKHRLCPYNVPIIDQRVRPGPGHRRRRSKPRLAALSLRGAVRRATESSITPRLIRASKAPPSSCSIMRTTSGRALTCVIAPHC
jgi:hypothetical protein